MTRAPLPALAGTLPAFLLLLLAGRAASLGPAYAGEQFVRFKSVPAALVQGRLSGGLSLTCSATGSPTPAVAWYRGGARLAGSQETPGGLGEGAARLTLPCLDQADAGLYECRAEAAGQKIVVATRVELAEHQPRSGCLGKQSAGPSITGWFPTVMLQSGQSARLACQLKPGTGGSVVWRDAAGKRILSEGRYRLHGTDLVISKASWADMGRFTCTAQNGFGVDMVSTFLYPLAPTMF